MTTLTKRPTLADLQRYVAKVCAERGWTKETYAEKFLLFVEEAGELAKAIRQSKSLYKRRQKRFALEEEFADVLLYLLDLANIFGVDLEKALRAKERVNRARTWH